MPRAPSPSFWASSKWFMQKTMLLGPHKGTAAWSRGANTDSFTVISAGSLKSHYVVPLGWHSVSLQVRFYSYSSWQMSERKLSQSPKSGSLMESVPSGRRGLAQRLDSRCDHLTCCELEGTVCKYVWQVSVGHMLARLASLQSHLRHFIRSKPSLELHTVDLINTKYTADVRLFFFFEK